MNLGDVSGPLVYLGVLIAAAVEGEVGYVAACALVSQSRLNPLGVVAAGATGAALGDQFYFYLLRAHLHRWLDRYEGIARRGRALSDRVRRHEAAMILTIRFAPGLRIALAAACAYAGVSPVRFSVLNAAASLAWAVGVMGIVAWVGPTYLPRLGISGWWSALVPGLLIVVVFWLLGRVERRAIANDAEREC